MYCLQAYNSREILLHGHVTVSQTQLSIIHVHDTILTDQSAYIFLTVYTVSYYHYKAVLSSVCANHMIQLRYPPPRVCVTKPLIASPSGSEIRLTFGVERETKALNLETMVT